MSHATNATSTATSHPNISSLTGHELDSLVYQHPAISSVPSCKNPNLSDLFHILTSSTNLVKCAPPYVLDFTSLSFNYSADHSCSIATHLLTGGEFGSKSLYLRSRCSIERLQRSNSSPFLMTLAPLSNSIATVFS